MPDLFAHGLWSMASLGRPLTRWVPQPQRRACGVRLAAITQVGEAISCSGQLTGLFERADARRARLSLQTTNPHGQVKLTADAVIVLP